MPAFNKRHGRCFCHGQTLVIRCVTQPDEHAKVLLSRLGLNLPNHLKRYRLAEPDPAVACAM